MAHRAEKTMIFMKLQCNSNVCLIDKTYIFAILRIGVIPTVDSRAMVGRFISQAVLEPKGSGWSVCF